MMIYASSEQDDQGRLVPLGEVLRQMRETGSQVEHLPMANPTTGKEETSSGETKGA
jgi:hypothetical protein